MDINVQKLLQLMFSNKELQESEPSIVKDFLNTELLNGAESKSKTDAMKVAIELLKQLNTINHHNDTENDQYSSLLSKVKE